MTRLALQSILMLLVMTVITGLLYPMTITLLAQTAFPHQANGSLLKNAKGQVVGSELLGQQFSQDKYFHTRPSATGGYPYNAAGSGGSNLGPTNQDLLKQIEERAEALTKANPGSKKIPTDLVTASSSGLDPHISVEAAQYQIERVAKARQINEAKVESLVRRETEDRQWRLFGEPRVNVLKLNLALDELI